MAPPTFLRFGEAVTHKSRLPNGDLSALSREAGDHLAVVCNPNHPFPVENASQAERELAIGEDIRWRRKRFVAHFAFPALVTFSFTPGSRRS